MKTFIQLKDNVGFAAINTPGETDGIQVAFGTGDEYIGKSYSDGSWSVAPTIKYAIVDENGSILEIRQTKFSSDLGPWPEWNSEIPTTWKWIDGAWVDPTPIVEVPAPEEPAPETPLE